MKRVITTILSMIHSPMPRRAANRGPLRTRRPDVLRSPLVALWLAVALMGGSRADAEPMPVRHVQAVLLPGDQVSFQRDGVEMTRLVFGKAKAFRDQPFLFPVIGPSGNPLTINHGHDAEAATHNSIWHSYGAINGIAFEGNHYDPKYPMSTGRQIHQRLENVTNGEGSASVTTLTHWVDIGKNPAETLLLEHRRYTVQPLDKGEWLLVVDSQFEAATDVTLGQSPIGFFSVKTTEALSINGGGSNRISSGETDLNGVSKKPAKWADYYGHPNPDAKESLLKVGNNGIEGDYYHQPNPNTKIIEGLAVFDHPKNLNYPTFWRARTHGRLMTSGITSDGVPVKLAKGKTLRLRYGVYVHGDQPAAAIEARWQAFATGDLDDLTPPKNPTKSPR